MLTIQEKKQSLPKDESKVVPIKFHPASYLLSNVLLDVLVSRPSFITLTQDELEQHCSTILWQFKKVPNEVLELAIEELRVISALQFSENSISFHLRKSVKLHEDQLVLAIYRVKNNVSRTAYNTEIHETLWELAIRMSQVEA